MNDIDRWWFLSPFLNRIYRCFRLSQCVPEYVFTCVRHDARHSTVPL